MDDKLDGKSLNITAENVEEIRALFPSVFAEGKVDLDKLATLLGEAVDEGKEKYAFTWKGKMDAIRMAQTRSAGTLRPCKEESVNWDATQNLYIEGDNLEVLKLLATSYAGANNPIKMIYIDPPYNKGKDFIYPDDSTDSIANYKKLTGQQSTSNPETDGRYHTKWLNLIYPRLKLAQVILAEDGIIFISIDDKEAANLRKIADEVFGEDSFVGTITWEKRTKCQNTTTARELMQSKTEYIYCYKKLNDKAYFRLEKVGDKEYDKMDEKGVYREKEVETMSALGMRGRTTMQFDILGVSPGTNKQWKIGSEQVEFFKNRNDIFVRDGKAILKVRPEDENNEVFKPFWSHFFDKDTYGTAEIGKSELVELIGTAGNEFETVKPVTLIKKLIAHIKDNKNDFTVLDFFSGSGTTAHAVMQLNAEDKGTRKFICVQLPELTEDGSEVQKAGYTNLCELGKDRIRRAGVQIVTTNPAVDIGFKVFKLDSTNLVVWDNTYSEDEEEVAKRIKQQSLFYLKEGRNDLDLVTEIMLKNGRPLTDKITEANVESVKVFVIENSEYKILVCLQPNIKLNAVESMVKDLPPIGTFIFADRCFTDANAVLNTREILKKYNRTLKLF